MRFILLVLSCAYGSFAALSPGIAENPIFLVIPKTDRAEVGSGFLFSHTNGIFLVTARHVLFDQGPSNTWSIKGTNLLMSYLSPTRREPLGGTVNLGMLDQRQMIAYHAKRDVAIVHLQVHTERGDAPLSFRNASNEFVLAVNLPTQLPQVSFEGVTRRIKDIKAGDTSYVLGYPSSVTLKWAGILDPERPLIRQALIADVDQARGHIVLDCAVYKGNSGGLVMVQDDSSIPPRLFTIGVVSKFIPFPEEWEHKEFGFKYVTTSNSGYAVVEPMDGVIELLEAFKIP